MLVSGRGEGNQMMRRWRTKRPMLRGRRLQMRVLGDRVGRGVGRGRRTSLEDLNRGKQEPKLPQSDVTSTQTGCWTTDRGRAH